MKVNCMYCNEEFDAKRKTAKFCCDLHRTLYGKRIKFTIPPPEQKYFTPVNQPVLDKFGSPVDGSKVRLDEVKLKVGGYEFPLIENKSMPPDEFAVIKRNYGTELDAILNNNIQKWEDFEWEKSQLKATAIFHKSATQHYEAGPPNGITPITDIVGFAIDRDLATIENVKKYSEWPIKYINREDLAKEVFKNQQNLIDSYLQRYPWLKSIQEYCEKASITPEVLIECHRHQNKAASAKKQGNKEEIPVKGMIQAGGITQMSKQALSIRDKKCGLSDKKD